MILYWPLISEATCNSYSYEPSFCSHIYWTLLCVVQSYLYLYLDRKFILQWCVQVMESCKRGPAQSISRWIQRARRRIERMESLPEHTVTTQSFNSRKDDTASVARVIVDELEKMVAYFDRSVSSASRVEVSILVDILHHPNWLRDINGSVSQDHFLCQLIQHIRRMDTDEPEVLDRDLRLEVCQSTLVFAYL